MVPILPAANVIKIGAQSLIDRGRSAVLPVVEELGANSREHQVQLVNGLKPGTITQAIRGEPVRTVITAT